MRLIVNGEAREFPDGTTLSELLRGLGVERNPVAVELNRRVVPRESHEATTLREGDRLEIVTLVGGG
jgi:sulfur carrier protein